MKTRSRWIRSLIGSLAAAALTPLDAAIWVAGNPQAPLPQNAQPPWEVSERPGASFLNAARRLVILEPNVGFSRRGEAADVTEGFQMAITMSVVTAGSPDPDGPAAIFGFRMADGRGQTATLSRGQISFFGLPGGTTGHTAAVDATVMQTYTLGLERNGTALEAVLRLGGGTILRAPLVTVLPDGGSALFFGSGPQTGGTTHWLAVADNAGGAPFSYQGRLNHPAGQAANGNFDFRFQLWDSVEGGTQVGSTIRLPNTPVNAGIFGVDLNFGTALVGGNTPAVLTPWLGIEVRPAGTDHSFTLLSPRTPLRPAPSALRAWRAASVDPGAAVRSLNGFRDDVSLTVGAGLTLQTDEANRTLQLSLTGAGSSTVTPHDHFGQAWQGANPLAGLLLANTDQGGAALRLDAAGDLIRGFPVGAQTGQPPSFRVTRQGDVTAQRFAGNGSQLTGLSWEQLPGTIPVERLPPIPRDKLPADLGGPGGGGPHTHFAEHWTGNTPAPGLWLDNTHGESVALLATVNAPAGTGVRASGQRAGLDASGGVSGIIANSSAGSSLTALTDTGMNLELISFGGDFIQATKRFTGQTFRVTADGDIFARRLNLSGAGSGIAGLTWDSLTGTVPAEKLPLIPRDKLPADLGGGAEHSHFGQSWTGNDPAKPVGLRLANQTAGGLGVLGIGPEAGIEGRYPEPGTPGAWPSIGQLGSRTAGVSGTHRDGMGVAGFSSFGTGVWAASEAGVPLSVEARGGAHLILGRRLNPDTTTDTVFQVLADGAVTGRSFTGDGAGLTGLNWTQLTGEVPEFRIPASIARTNHNHAGETWSSSGTTLTLQAQGPAGTFALRALAGEGVAISAESLMGTAIGGVTWSNDRAGVQGEAIMGGAGILGTANSGTGVMGSSRLGTGVAAASTGGAALSASTATGAVIRGFRNTETSSDEVFTVTGTGDVTAAGSFSATAFNTTSDRHAKTGFTAVDPQEVLRKVAALPITRWAFTNTASVAHIGPVAQDFHAAFGVGTDDRHIATVDADGVALAAIQGLNAKLESELRTKDAELRALKDELAEIRQLLRGSPQPQP